MLVLSRKVDEVIRIGEDIEVMVVDICGDKVKLGVRAPTKIPVHRQEVYDAIKRRDSVKGRGVPCLRQPPGTEARQ